MNIAALIEAIREIFTPRSHYVLIIMILLLVLSIFIVFSRSRLLVLFYFLLFAAISFVMWVLGNNYRLFILTATSFVFLGYILRYYVIREIQKATDALPGLNVSAAKKITKIGLITYLLIIPILTYIYLMIEYFFPSEGV